MARTRGTLRLGSNLEPQMDAPLDAREVVQSEADLTAAESFPYSYIGMAVWCIEKECRYVLIGADPTQIANWKVDGGGSGGSGGELEHSLEVTESVGGIPVGKTYAAGDKIEDILNDMLNPLEYPSLTNPSASLAFASGHSALTEDGTADIRKNIVCTFNRGSISPAYGTSGYRAGAAEEYQDSVSGTWQASNTFNNVAFPASGSVTVSVKHAAGEQPKDSHGKNYDVPLPANTVVSNGLSVVLVNALYDNTADITTIAKKPLINYNTTKTREMNFPAQTVANPEAFDIPAALNVTKIEVLNDLSGKYEDCMAEFTASNVTHQNAGGADVNYKRYTDNRGYNAGPRTIKVTWA